MRLALVNSTAKELFECNTGNVLKNIEGATALLEQLAVPALGGEKLALTNLDYEKVLTHKESVAATIMAVLKLLDNVSASFS